MDNNERPTVPYTPSSATSSLPPSLPSSGTGMAGMANDSFQRTDASGQGRDGPAATARSTTQGQPEQAPAGDKPVQSSKGDGSNGDGSTDDNKDSTTMDRVVQGAHDTVDRLAETAAPHVQRLKDSAEGLRSAGDEWSESLRTTVRANPLAAVAAALAVGVVFAKLTS